ncbi:MAG TPA: SusC/RagA family TonB-linked outer membrane protein [Gemmatimonadaceae bacterium]|nr:SusC/RagA family TonB-linked outer membrane protein [Gemmatimonadaceae bacterium]
MRNRTRVRAIVMALFAALVAVATPGQAAAQNAVITGKVTTEFGQAVEGANVFISEMSISVGTNAAGDYTINIPAARVQGQQVNLRVRAFGYQPQVRPVRVTAGSQTFNFSMKQDVNRLAEVVVTGVTAGTEQKKLPFTVARVDEREMPVPASNPLSQLQGKVPGANIVSTTGRPGASPAVMLRGPKSINAQGRGQGPLLIVDGVVLQGGLGDINPADIETVEVVKGAAASSLYGSRAGNGVIQITTKSGKNAGEGVRFTARTEYGFGDIEGRYTTSENHMMLMDETKTRFCVTVTGAPRCARTVDFEDEALRVNENAAEQALSPVSFTNDVGISAAPASKQVLRNLFAVERWPRQYDPVGQMVTNGQRVTSTLDATGRVRGTTFFASGSNYIEEGAIKFLDGYKRQSARLNVDQEVGEDWTFGVRTFYSRNWSDGGNFENNNNRGFFGITRTPAGVDLLREDKFNRLFIRSNPTNQGLQNENPMYWFANAKQENQNDRYLGAANARYTPLSWLDFDGNLSYDRTNASAFFQRDRGFRTTGNSPNNPLGANSAATGVDQSYNSSLSAGARQTLLDDALNVRYTARYLYEQQDFSDFSLSGSTLAVAGLWTLSNSTASFAVGSGESSIRSVGMMAGVDADYKERYIVGALIRRDGSSLFGAANRWANYGRGSLAWRASEEPWWMLPQLNDLKLRASIGTAGGRPTFSAQYETYSIGTGGTLNPNTLGNKNLRPETVTETEVGIDAEILSRFGVTLNYAKAVAKDQILRVVPPVISGFNNQWQNAGTMENTTFEASINIPLIQRRNFNWSTRFNYDNTESIITKLNVPPFFDGPAVQGADQMFQFREGEKYGTIYGRKFATSCAELPAPFNTQCGGASPQFEVNSDGLLVWTGGKGLGAGITQNAWNAFLPGCVNAAGTQVLATNPGAVACAAGGATNQVMAPWGTTINYGMPIILRDSTANALKLPLGNVLPDYRVNVSQTMNYKKLFVYGLLDASIGQYVWNEGRHWSFGDFQTSEVDQAGKSVAEARPLGYYWRAPSPDNGIGVGGLYDILGPHSVTTEKASYAKLREVNVSYNVGAVRGVGDWTVSFVGRNLYTFTDYKGFDPEVGVTGATGITGSSALNAVDAFNFPNLRTFNFSLSTKF